MPSRLLARLVWLDRNPESTRYADPPLVPMANPPPAPFYYPGPWSYFASGYAVSLFAMVSHINSELWLMIHTAPQALLLNRIQNIVVPSRRPLPHRTRPNSRRRWPFFIPSIFPLDLSSTYSRTILRLPSMYYVLKSLLLWSVLLLQASDHFPPFSWKPFQLLDNWASRKEMDEICWFTFRAICGALCVGALTRGLEGVGATNASPFNLVCSFTLYSLSTFL
jgi:hypothetical protein